METHSPKKPTLQPDNPSKSTHKHPLFELLEQIKEIPWTSLWNFALALGGFFLITYFASIGFLPDLDLQAAAGTVVAVAIIGLFLVVNLGFGLLLPTLFIRADDEGKKALQTAESLTGVVFAFAILVVFAQFDEWSRVLFLAIWLVLLLVAGLCAVYFFSSTRTLTDVLYFFPVVVLWGVWAASFPMLFYALLTSQSGRSESHDYLYLFLFPLLFAVISLVVAELPKPQRIAGRIVALIAVVWLLSVLSNRPAFVPQTVVSLLGLSVQQSSVTLIVSEAGCHTANLILEGAPCTGDPVAKLGRVSGVKIISRIGAQVVIDWKPVAASGTATVNAVGKEVWRRVVLRKEDVVSWAYDSPKLHTAQQPKP
jgi:hypothetical protein